MRGDLLLGNGSLSYPISNASVAQAGNLDMAEQVQELCGLCERNYFASIAEFHHKNTLAIAFFRKHGILPNNVICPNRKNQCRLIFVKTITFGGVITLPNSKNRRRCNFSISDYKGTFLENCRFEPWKLLSFIIHWISKLWDHKTITV